MFCDLLDFEGDAHEGTGILGIICEHSGRSVIELAAIADLRRLLRFLFPRRGFAEGLVMFRQMRLHGRDVLLGDFNSPSR